MSEISVTDFVRAPEFDEVFGREIYGLVTQLAGNTVTLELCDENAVPIHQTAFGNVHRCELRPHPAHGR